MKAIDMSSMMVDLLDMRYTAEYFGIVQEEGSVMDDMHMYTVAAEFVAESKEILSAVVAVVA